MIRNLDLLYRDIDCCVTLELKIPCIKTDVG